MAKYCCSVTKWWTSLVAQLVKNLPAMYETQVWSLSWEDPLEEGMATHSSILTWRIPTDRGAWRATVHGVAKSLTWLSDAVNGVQLFVTPWTATRWASLSFTISWSLLKLILKYYHLLNVSSPPNLPVHLVSLVLIVLAHPILWLLGAFGEHSSILL